MIYKMAEIVFESDNISKQVPDGSKIATIADEAQATLPFGCREASCGACRLLVLEGMENLSDVIEDEIDVLGQDKVNEGYRLGCQISIKSGKVVIRNG
jgi:ferredoxin